MLSSTMPAVGSPAHDEPPPGRPSGRLRRLLAYIRRHPFRSVLFAAAFLLAYELLTIPWTDVPRLAYVNPPETALMRQRMREAASEGKPLKISHRWIPLSRLPRHLIGAVVVAEDGTFFSHSGFDWYEVRASVEKNMQQGRLARGASTITQQLAKNLYLSTSKDPVRKLKEVVITMLLEQCLTKNRILELYLNEIEWGRGVFGVETAAQLYFHKSAAGLSPDESARLAAVIPSPLKHRPDADSRYVVRRTAMVMRRLAARARGVIITTEEDQSSSSPVNDVDAGEQETDSTDTDTE